MLMSGFCVRCKFAINIETQDIWALSRSKINPIFQVGRCLDYMGKLAEYLNHKIDDDLGRTLSN